ncbi:MAG: hypothetical protein CMH53_02370 [Myxococcales bacterium]|nr:hypothetical protein [Myxococcales bacterium]
MGELQPDAIAQSLEAFEQLAELQQSCNPTLPQMSGKELHWGWTRHAQHEPRGLWGMYDQGRLIAAASACPQWWRTPAESVVMTLDVHPHWRGRGLGSTLIRHIEHHYRDSAMRKIATMVAHGEQDDDAFWLRRGFRIQGRFHQSGFDLSKPLDEVHRLRNKQIHEDGFEIIDGDELRQRFPRVWRRRWWRLWSEAEQDMPGPEPPNPRPFDVFVQILERPGLDLSLCHFCLHNDEITGFTSLIPYGLSPQFAAIWMTGVARGLRRKGIATAVKVASLDAAKRRGLSWVITENEQTNPTHTLNVALGFTPRYTRLWMVNNRSAA